MADAGDYTFIQNGETSIEAMIDAPGRDVEPYWNFAFKVDDIEAARLAVEEGGGNVMDRRSCRTTTAAGSNS